jgi:hypothetical protein
MPCIIQNNTPLPLLVEYWQNIAQRRELGLLYNVLPAFTEKMYYSVNDEYMVSGLFENTDFVNNTIWEQYGYKTQMICIFSSYWGNIDKKTNEFEIEYDIDMKTLSIGIVVDMVGLK